MNAALIVRSLELSAAHCADMTPLVYRRLFADHPEMRPLFARDTNDAVKGEMLARVFEAILDFVTDRSYAAKLIQCEVMTHAGYDVPPDVFGTFFDTVADTVHEVLGDDWSDEMADAWRSMLADLHYFVEHPDQNETAG
ncbi:MAG: globin [Rhizomicrobium sp.]|jgi:hemoglobin-like flavoprotein